MNIFGTSANLQLKWMFIENYNMHKIYITTTLELGYDNYIRLWLHHTPENANRTYRKLI